MEETVTKIILLGIDSEILKNVTDKVNKTRPAEVTYCSDLRDFLTHCIEQQPDIIGISVGFPHKSVARFPKIFRMAFNTPVLTFGEKQDPKTRKLLSSSSADLKISGVINAHNLWMKIINFKKMQEDAEAAVKNSSANNNENQKIIMKNSIFLKGEKKENVGENSNSLLNSLFAALDNPDKKDNQSNINMIKSTNATQHKKEKLNHVSNTENDGDVIPQVGHTHISGEESSAPTMAPSQSVQSGKPVIGSGESEINDLGQLASSLGLESESTNDPREAFQNNFDEVAKKNDVSSDLERPQKDFGKVQITDQKELKNIAKVKAKEQTERENFKNKNILVASCELALNKVFGSKPVLEPEAFNPVKVNAFIVEVGSYKGFLILADSKSKGIDDVKHSEFRKIILENLQKNNLFGEISKALVIDASVEDYSSTLDEFSEFSINFIGDGKQVVSFVKREVVKPSFEPSEKEDMFFIDIKVIPPITPVNFDAFLFLPKNKKFVRYLKPGRSLSLKQAKRHTEEEDGQSKLYLPKTQKWQFIQFYVQNTMNWEFALYAPPQKESA